MIDLSLICNAIAYWLNYKNLTGLEGLFSEASLTVPVAEYLKARHVHSLRAEVNHPKFIKVRGRPRQIDFVAVGKNEQWFFAIEAKYFPTTIQQISNDIGRLLVLERPGCEKFLILAGPAGSDSKNPFKINITVNHRRRNAMERFFLHKRGSSKIVKLMTEPAKIRELFANFFEDYKLARMPNAFEITCVNFYKSKRFAVGIWKISLRQGTGHVTSDGLRHTKS